MNVRRFARPLALLIVLIGLVFGTTFATRAATGAVARGDQRGSSADTRRRAGEHMVASDASHRPDAPAVATGRKADGRRVQPVAATSTASVVGRAAVARVGLESRSCLDGSAHPPRSGRSPPAV